MEILEKGANAPFSFGRLAIPRREPFYAKYTNSQLFFAKTLLHLPIDILPLLWDNISVIKREENTYYD